jgi:hypothetical protein
MTNVEALTVRIAAWMDHDAEQPADPLDDKAIEEAARTGLGVLARHGPGAFHLAGPHPGAPDTPPSPPRERKESGDHEPPRRRLDL